VLATRTARPDVTAHRRRYYRIPLRELESNPNVRSGAMTVTELWNESIRSADGEYGGMMVRNRHTHTPPPRVRVRCWWLTLPWAALRGTAAQHLLVRLLARAASPPLPGLSWLAQQQLPPPRGSRSPPYGHQPQHAERLVAHHHQGQLGQVTVCSCPGTACPWVSRGSARSRALSFCLQLWPDASDVPHLLRRSRHHRHHCRVLAPLSAERPCPLSARSPARRWAGAGRAIVVFS
jgi:hypothetical protein